MTLLGTCIHGSKLFGLDNPQSDTDLKSIFLPALDDCLLLRAPRNTQQKSGEGAGKTEHESFALQEFLKLAANAEDVAITLLHADDRFVRHDSPVFSMLRRERHRFYTKRMSGQLGYARSQASKYALRADRMAAVERVIAVLEQARDRGVGRLYQCWDDLPDGEHIIRTVSDNNRDNVDKRIYEVAGKGLPATITPQYALDILTRLRDNYGDRVRAAKSIDGKDWKSLSHAFRVGYQLKHVYEDGDFYFPLPESDFIRAVKEGRCDYLADKIDEKLNGLIAEVERLAEESDYPAKVDQDWLDQIVLDAYGR
jgi:hypothetical protein